MRRNLGSNHHLASNLKNACKLRDLELDILAWDSAKGEIMFEIAEKKFRQATLAALLRQPGDKILVEASQYDPDFDVGFQAAVVTPSNDEMIGALSNADFLHVCPL